MHIYEKYRQFYNRVFCESKYCRYADVYPHVQCTQYKHLHLSHPALWEFLRAFRIVFCRFRFRDYQGGYKYLFQLTNHTLFCLWKLRHTHIRQFFRWVRLQYKGTFLSVVFMRFANSSMLGTSYSNVIAVFSIYGLYIASNSSASLICAVLICNLSFTIMTSLILYDIIILH